eukprot:COSAG06_NODE_329_length_17412_cov_9.404015_16_plen_67_part_00
MCAQAAVHLGVACLGALGRNLPLQAVKQDERFAGHLRDARWPLTHGRSDGHRLLVLYRRGRLRLQQ